MNYPPDTPNLELEVRGAHQLRVVNSCTLRSARPLAPPRSLCKPRARLRFCYPRCRGSLVRIHMQATSSIKSNEFLTIGSLGCTLVWPSTDAVAMSRQRICMRTSAQDGLDKLGLKRLRLAPKQWPNRRRTGGLPSAVAWQKRIVRSQVAATRLAGHDGGKGNDPLKPPRLPEAPRRARRHPRPAAHAETRTPLPPTPPRSMDLAIATEGGPSGVFNAHGPSMPPLNRQTAAESAPTERMAGTDKGAWSSVRRCSVSERRP